MEHKQNNMKYTILLWLASTLAGWGQVQYAFTNLAGFPGGSGSADGTGSQAGFKNPAATAVDGTGNAYVADYLTTRFAK